MNLNFDLTIGIVSYNRPHQLFRTLKSLLPIPQNVEILICDDKSPKILEIKSIISDCLVNPNIKLIVNDTNLGYDRNLFKLFELSNSNHILLLGDDDYLEINTISNVLLFLKNNVNVQCAFLKFKDLNNNKLSRNFHKDLYFNKNVLLQNGDFIYNSILFSGLIFNKNIVLDNKKLISNYFHSIYIQVAFFIIINIQHGSYFINGPGVIIGGDGDNGFGLNDASKNTDFDLTDRTSVLSNISYHKRLFKLLIDIENKLDINITKVFIREYKLRSFKAIYNAKLISKKNAKLYLKNLKLLNIPTFNLILPIYYIILLTPNYFLLFFVNFAEKILLKFRIYNKQKKYAK